ncbi:ubiquitin carboxyl-terminal hydrolase 19 [Niveomyces insectorum RCEF 264]|uniref:Ubiquitin carboxyl-terminal hydrolase 19 n=1 Tax=Niveomyces insectorum RCEF 264 TaxID=1081102 RepID=A0A167QQN3_9HYPO|nr:ubiquitin carboxyl-terminal hydrolase 19 [Niveomyces insectorum RCEF 264]
MAAPYPQVVLFGDSLFQGAAPLQDGFSLQAALQAHCIRRFDVVNRGLAGYNTSQALRVLPSIIPAPPPAAAASYTPTLAYFVVLLGANDAALPTKELNQHVDMEEYAANLRAILTHPHVQAYKPGKILVVTPPPVDGIRLGEYERLTEGPPDAAASRQARITAAYAETARRVAKSVPGAVVVDLWKALMDVAVARTPGFDPAANGGLLLGDEEGGQQGYLTQLLTDGLHLSGEGYRILFEELRAHIEPEHPNKKNDDDTAEGWVYAEWRKAPWHEKDKQHAKEE